jgi:thioesterase domain-containing protein
MVPTKPSPLVLLKPGSSGPAVFIVPGRNDDAAVLLGFCNTIQFAGSIFGLQPRGLDCREQPYDSIEEIAQDFASAMLNIQPVGSYNIIGVSLGGLVALEIAQQLIRTGNPISFFGLLDTYPDPRYWPLRCWLAVLASRAQHHATNVVKLSASNVLPYIAKISESLLDHFRSRLGKTPKMKWSKGTIEGSETLRRLEESNARALSRYQPHKYPGKITFVQARPVDVGGTKFPGNPATIWSGLCQAFELHVVQSDHLAMVRADSDRVASVLAECLQREHIGMA